MRIATWNINGIKARHDLLVDWLRSEQPDACVLQELKSQDHTFPREAIEDAGYTLETHGQKSFNGVALLARGPIEDVVRGLPDPEGAGPEGADDEQARWIEGTVFGEDGGALRLCGLYLPNGNPAPGPKYDYKLRWMSRLEARTRALLEDETAFALAGDFNTIPERRDADRPDAWTEDALHLPATRAAWRRLVGLGLHDATREVSEADGVYTFWDYQGGAWDKNDGIRIDHILFSPQAADRLAAARVQHEMRGREKPSDHVPVWATLDL
ncbi:MAG: exodeoxyribonuclease III [Pseudomonadota bacterium]